MILYSLILLLVLFIKLFIHLLSVCFSFYAFFYLFAILLILSLSFIYIISFSFYSKPFFLVSIFPLFPFNFCFFYFLLPLLPLSQQLDFLISLLYLSRPFFHFNLTPSFHSSFLIFLLMPVSFLLDVLSISVARSQIFHTFVSVLRLLVHCCICIRVSSVTQMSITNIPPLLFIFFISQNIAICPKTLAVVFDNHYSWHVGITCTDTSPIKLNHN